MCFNCQYALAERANATTSLQHQVTLFIFLLIYLNDVICAVDLGVHLLTSVQHFLIF